MASESDANPQKKGGKVYLTVALLVLAAVVVVITLYIANRPLNAPPPPRLKARQRQHSQQRQNALFRAKSLLARRQWGAANDLLAEYAKSNPHDIEALMMLAKSEVLLKRFSAAEKTIDRVIRLQPRNPEALWLKGELVAKRKGNNPMYFLRQAAEFADKTTPGIWADFGIILLAEGEFREAEQFLRRAMDAGLNDIRTLGGMGDLSLRREDYASAVKWLEEARKIAPADIRIWGLLAEAQLNAGNASEAEKTLQQALKNCRGKGKGPLLFELGKVQLLKKSSADRLRQAGDTFARAADYPRVRAEASFRAARCYYLTGRYALAMKYIDIAARLKPNHTKIKQWVHKIEDARFPRPVGAR